MKIMENIPLIFILCLLFSFSISQASISDFCVADFSYPQSPAGFSCKNPKTVNENDFYANGALNSPIIDKLFKAGISPAFVDKIPGLNGLPVSLARVDYQPGGVVPIHTHPDATEILTVLQGNLTVGFISSNNTVYMKSIGPGDVFVFPRGLLHFQVNIGRTRVVAIVAFSSESPNIQFVDTALFSNNLSTQLITAITFINSIEVKRLKAIFGGSG